MSRHRLIRDLLNTKQGPGLRAQETYKLYGTEIMDERQMIKEALVGPGALGLLTEPQDTCGCLISGVFQETRNHGQETRDESSLLGKRPEKGALRIMLVMDGGAQLSIS